MPYTATDALLIPLFLQGDVQNVVAVNEAYFIPALWEATTLISRSLARLPLYVTKTEDKDYGHLALNRLFNKDQSSFLVRQTMYQNLALHGESFALIKDSKLIPLKFNAITMVSRDANGDRFFRMANGRTYTQREVFHVLGSSIDGVRGLSPLETNGLTLNLARAVDEYGQKFFKQRRPVTVLKTQSDLDADAAEELASRYASASTDKGIFVIDRNSELTALNGTPNEAQFNETRQSMVLAVARIFQIPPSKLGVLDYSTFNNITEENTSFVRDCLMNYSAPFEAEFEFWFGHKLGHDFTSLLEQSFEARSVSATKLVDSGILTPNEARARLNYPPVEGGDELRIREHDRTRQEAAEDLKEEANF